MLFYFVHVNDCDYALAEPTEALGAVVHPPPHGGAATAEVIRHSVHAAYKEGLVHRTPPFLRIMAI